jgi:protein-disulfide isomerase
MTYLPPFNRRHIMAGVALAALWPARAMAQEAKPDLAKLNEAPAIGEMTIGVETAKVTIIEYASASCPHCAAFFKEVYVPLKKDYIDTGKVRFIFREFPHNDLGLAAFMVARCAPKDKYFSLVDKLFETQDKWMSDPVNELKLIAQGAGMSEAEFDACLKNEKVMLDIQAIRKRGEEVGVNSIPTIFINGERFDGDRSIEAMKTKIDPLLNG